MSGHRVMFKEQLRHDRGYSMGERKGKQLVGKMLHQCPAHHRSPLRTTHPPPPPPLSGPARGHSPRNCTAK